MMKDIPQSGTSFTDDGRYRLLIDAVTDYAIYMLDPEGLVSSWNPGAKRFKGYEEAEILGQHFSRFYTAEDRAAGLPQRALNIAASQGRFEGEGWRVRKGGERFWSHIVIDPIRSATGALLGFAKITRDLTERRLAEQSLKQSEEQFRLLVQGVTDYALYMLDPAGRITSWNLGGERIKGYLPSEIIGQHFSLFYSEEDRENGQPQRSLDTAVSEGRFESQGWRIRKDGTRFWANVVIDPIHSELGILLGFAKITRDITDAMNAQRALDDARKALFQAQKMEAIGRLTGGVAHDFNNLLMAILGSLEIALKRVPGDAKVISLLNNAIQGAQRGVSLTQRMLAFARSQKLTLERVDTAELVHGLLEMLQRSLGPQIRIETRLSHTLKPIMGDCNQLELALLNLTVNARDAMPDGGLIIIEAWEEQVPTDAQYLKPGGYVCLSLADNGEGMDEGTLARATEPFFTTKGVGKGTGLGLSMVHGFAEQSGGQLVLNSEKGRGTTAVLWLPMANADAVASSRKLSMSTPISSAHAPSLSILIVDDDAIVLLSTSAMLEDLGFSVFEAQSGIQALEILDREAHIDLVITDQAMPHMTGMQLIDAIEARGLTVPVLLASGYTDQLDQTTSKTNNLPRLSKPFNQDALERAVLNALQRT